MAITNFFYIYPPGLLRYLCKSVLHNSYPSLLYLLSRVAISISVHSRVKRTLQDCMDYKSHKHQPAWLGILRVTRWKRGQTSCTGNIYLEEDISAGVALGNCVVPHVATSFKTCTWGHFLFLKLKEPCPPFHWTTLKIMRVVVQTPRGQHISSPWYKGCNPTELSNTAITPFVCSLSGNNKCEGRHTH